MKIAVNILLCLILFLTSSIGFSATAENYPAQEKVSLQLKWFHQFQFAGYYAAKEQGYYAQEGLDVEIRERSGDKDAVKQVVSGEVDFAVGDSGILTYYAKGEPIIALAAIFQHNPLVFIAKQSSGILSPYEMRGKKIMLDTVGAGSASLRAILAEANLDEKSYTTVKQSFRNDDLIENKFDVMLAYLSDQPFYFQKKKIRVNIINPQSFGIDFYGDILFTSQEELAKHPGRAEKFRRATLKGWQYALDHPEELTQLIHGKYHSKLPVEHLRFEANVTRKLILPDLIPLGQMDARRLQKVTEVYSQLKISRALNEDELAKFIYTSNSLSLTEQEYAWLKAHPLIHLGVDRDFAPYEWLDADGNYVGIAADYIAVLKRVLGVEFAVVKDKSWAEVLDMARAGQLDMIACVVNTPERSKYLNFSKSFISNPVIIINDIRHGFISSLRNLNGKRVVIEKGYFMQELLQRDYPKIELLAVDNVKEALNQVAMAKADAYIGDAASATHAIQASGILHLGFAGETGYFSPHSMAVVKSNPELYSIITKALNTISISEQERIKQHWLSRPVSSGIQPATVIKYGLGVLLVFMLFTGWNFRLRKEVSRRKKIEQQLRTLSVAIEQSPASVVITDLKANLQYVNPKFSEVTGYSMEEALGKNPHILHSGLTSAEVYQQMWDSLNQGQVWHGELLNQRKNGEHYWEEAYIAPVKNSVGVITNYVAVKIEITDRKRMEQQLLDNAAFTSGILDSLSSHIAVLNADGIIVAVNQAWHKFAKDNGKPEHKTCKVGDNYLKFCQRSFNYSQLKQAVTVQYGITTVLEGLRESFELEFPCHTATEQRWFAMRVTPLKGMQQGVVVNHVNISHLKQAELAMADSKALLLKVIDTVPMRVFWKDCNLRYLGCNMAFAKDAGMSHPSALIGKDDYQMGWCDQAELYRNDDRAVLESGIARISFDEQQTRPDGQTIWLRTSKVPLKNQNNDTIGLLGVYEDVTARKLAEQDLKKTQERFDLSQKYGEIGTWEADLITNKQIWSQNACDLIGLPDLKNPTWQDFVAIIYPEDRKKVIDATQDHLKLGKKYDIEYRIRLPDNEIRWMRSAGKAQFADDGTAIKFIGIMQDVTEQKLLEEKIRFLFEFSPIGFALNELTTGNFIEINPAMYAGTGYSKEEFLALSYWDLTPREYEPQEQLQLQSLSSTGRYGPYEKEYIRKDGSRYPILLNGVLMRDSTGHELIWSIVENITDRKQAEMELMNAKEKAVAASQAKSEFLANMSHEIRTPMNAILGFSAILSDLIIDEKQRHYLNAIKRSGKTLLQLINDILDLSKIEAGKFELNISPLSLKTIFEDISTIFTPQLTEKNIVFTLTFSENIPACLFLDEIRLRQVLLNIVGNAVKFTDQGFIRINVTGQPAGDERHINLNIRIADSGMGIEKDQLDAIFDAFTQQKQQNVRYGGTGLGLTISKRLAELMGGSLRVESRAGQGSCFTIELPQVEMGYSHQQIALPETAAPKPQPVQVVQAAAEKAVETESLPELMALLSSDYQQLIARLHDSGVLEIDLLIDVSEQLLKIAEHYHCTLLREWADTLKTQAELFELEKLPKTLSSFDDLIKRM